MAIPPLMPQQELASWFIQTRPYAGIFLTMSAGKCLAVLDAFSRIRPEGHVLIIAPVKIARLTWIDEITKWEVDVRCRSLIVDERDKRLTKKQRYSRYEELLDDSTPPTLWFINQELVRDLVDFFHRDHDHLWPFPTVVIDESQGFKSPSSVRFKSLARVRPMISRLIELSGTPLPNTLEDIWSQVWLLDMGASLGSSMTAFHREFFYSTMSTPAGVPIRWEPREGAQEEVFRRVSHLVMSTTTSVPDLPEMVVHDYPVSLDDDAVRIYKRLRRDLVTSVIGPDGSADTVSAVNSAVLRTKLLQMASGTIYPDSDCVEDTVPKDPSRRLRTQQGREYTVLHTAKLDALSRIIKQTPSPVLVAYRFVCDRELITSYLTAFGTSVETFDGSRQMYDRWNAGQVPVMLIHPASSGHGLNLQQGGHTLVWYTLPDSLEHYLQANKRLHRTGQRQQVDVYRLLSRGTIDESVPGALLGKEQTQNAFLEAVHREITEALA